MVSLSCNFRWWLWQAILIGTGMMAAAQTFAENPIDYNFDIKPILSDRCYKCHGPDAGQRQADLRLDVSEGPESPFAHEVIVAGDPDASSLWQRLIASDPDEQMPPPSSKLPPLTADERERVRRWIAEGAKWKRHWSFIPLSEVGLPETAASDWIQNSIDSFVLARLESKQVLPSPEADRETLIRRLTFDLTGLPPTADEIDTFLRDDSSQAYEALIDRLLESEGYGEHVAVHWLDLARYADSYGYQVDFDRRVWPWRDWVIRALNRNLPYDQFITWQLAGDMLPAATDEQILATTFNRLHPQKVEGGSIPEEFRVEYVADRTHTFGTAMLGLTLECSRCHDHKYDPMTQRDYYQLFAFFNNIDECGLYSYRTYKTSIPTPTLLLADDDAKKHLAEFETSVSTAEADLEALRDSRRDAFNDWVTRREVASDSLIPNRIAYCPLDEMVGGKSPNIDNAEVPATTSGGNRLVPGRFGQALLLNGDDEVHIKTGAFTQHDPFSFSLWIRADQLKERMVVLHRTQGWTDAGSRGYQLLLEEGRPSFSLIHFWPGDAIRIRCNNPVPLDSWVHLAVTYDGSGRAAGLKIYRDGAVDTYETVRDKLLKTIADEIDHVVLGARDRDQGFTGGMLDDLQVFDRQLTKLEVAQLFDGNSLQHTLETPLEEVSPSAREALFEYYLLTIDEDYRQKLESLTKLRHEHGDFLNKIPEIMVMREMHPERSTFVLKRGAYDAPGEPVEPQIPEFLHTAAGDVPRNRLELAAWLTDPQNPLTARVAVNRFWQICFGEGLVRTPEDFGSQGALPTHPQLLDWLAKDFIDHGWNLKRLFKQIVSSATYRQSSQPRAELNSRDPRNRWLARGPRQRLTAEMIRDNALLSSGLLVEKIGGAPVRPYEVTVSFKPLPKDSNEGLYRRSMYTEWRRTGPPPMMTALDAAKRDVCVVKREQTSTPLQALVLFNSPQMVEAARVLGQGLVEKHGADSNVLLSEMFRAMTGKRPDERQQQVLQAMYNEQLQYFAEHPEHAQELIGVGDSPASEKTDSDHVAAAAVVAGALFNFDACMMKR